MRQIATATKAKASQKMVLFLTSVANIDEFTAKEVNATAYTIKTALTHGWIKVVKTLKGAGRGRPQKVYAISAKGKKLVV